MSKSAGLQILQLRPFLEFPWLIHGFSTRPGGASSLNGEKVLNLSFVEWDTHENVVENRRAFQSALNATDFSLVVMKQIHSDVVHPFPQLPDRPCKGDASITDRPGLLLGVQTADCVPILIVDPRKRAVAAVHAGWRGTLGRIVEKTVGRLRLEYGSKPGGLLAALGPSIGPCCYEVGADFVAKFAAQFADAAAFFDDGMGRAFLKTYAGSRPIRATEAAVFRRARANTRRPRQARGRYRIGY